MDISCWMARRADLEPGSVAVVYEGESLGYADLAGRIDRLAGALRELGVARGDRVAHLGRNDPEILSLVFACARLGATLLPLNWRLAAPEHDYILDHAEPSLLVADAEFADHAERLAGVPERRVLLGGERDGWHAHAALVAAARPLGEGAGRGRADDALYLVYTSGTTGRPKGALLSQGALLATAVNGTHAFDLTAADVSLNALPMFHVGGLNLQCIPTLFAGGTVLLQRAFDPGAALDAIPGHRVTLFVAVPAMLAALVAHPAWATADLSSLRCLTTGASTVPERLVSAVLDRGLPMNQVYGTTETCPTVAYTRPGRTGSQARSCGQAALLNALRVVDDDGVDVPDGTTGELWVRGPNIMQGYWRDPEASAAALVDGWFRTGDLVHRDADGCCYLDDRKKDVIISGGENIYSAELEQVLDDCPEILEAAVVARPHPKYTEVPVAAVVKRNGSGLDADGVLALFAGRLARYKHPQAVVFMAALPRNVMGKVLKYELREQLREGVNDA